jgi:glutathione synthase/RimK-type ligase-like ATP-grasp enzyme
VTPPDRRRLAVVTCDRLPVPDPDRALIDRSLDDLGHAGRWAWVPWRGDLDWRSFGLVWIRTPWDYVDHYEEFLAWLDRIEDQVAVVNPVPVLRWNSHKRYLRDLEDDGVAVVPTRIVDPASADLDELLEANGWPEAVVKPAVSVGAIGASRVSIGAPDHAAALARAGVRGEVLVQPYLTTIAEGETSVVVLDGQVSHAVRKVPADGEFRVHAEYGGSERRHEPTATELALVEEALAAVPSPEPLTYARVDCVTDTDGAPRLMELELIEPSLFLPLAPPAEVDRLVAAVIARLDADRSG